MTMNRKWMTILFFLGVLILLGCGASRDKMTAYKDAKDAFQMATLAGARQCAPCECATAEVYLALAERETKRFLGLGDEASSRLKMAVAITKEKSLEAIKICQAHAQLTAPAPLSSPTPVPTPTAPLSQGR